MPGPLTHARISRRNARRFCLSEEGFLQRILGAVIPDTPVIDGSIHSRSISVSRGERYGDFLIGVREHVETDRLYHGGLTVYFSHELAEIYSDFRLFLRENGGRAKLCDVILCSLDYGKKNLVEIGGLVAKVCGTDREQTMAGLDKYMDFVGLYASSLRRLDSLFS